MSAPSAIIGGERRHLGAWKPNPRKLGAARPDVNLAALSMVKTIEGFPLDFNQGQLSSCGPNAVGEVFTFDHEQRFSRLFLYFFVRASEGDFWDDDGVIIDDLISVAHTMGMPLETSWDYDIAKFDVPPPIATLGEAQLHKVINTDVVADLEHLLFELDNDQPVTFGFQVPASMEDGRSGTATTGIVDPIMTTNPSIGGHCVNAIGFDRSRQLVKCTCHYGAGFGDGGAIWLPFSYFTSGLACDMRAIRAVS